MSKLQHLTAASGVQTVVMANDKSKHEDHPPRSPSLLQWFDEIEKNEAAKFRGPVNSTNAVGADDRTMPDPLMPCFPLPGTEGTSNYYAKQMPVLDLNLMNDFAPFSNSQNLLPADNYRTGKGLLPIADSDFLCCEGNTDFGYSVIPHGVVNASSKARNVQNPHVDRELVSAIGSTAPVNSIQRKGDLDSFNSRPQLIDNFTSDGGNTSMSWPTLDDVEIDGSCLTLGIGCKSNDVLARNVGYDSETNVLPRSNIFHSQNTNRSLHLFPDVATSFSCVQNNMNQVEKQQFPVPGKRNVFLGVEGNCDKRSLYFDPNNGIQGYPAVPFLPVDNSLARLPDSGLSKVSELSWSSCLNKSTSLPQSDQSQKHRTESVSRNTSLHIQSGKPFTANEGIAAQVAEQGLFPEEFRFSQLHSQDFPATQVNMAVRRSGTFVGTSVKRAAAETFTATSNAEASKVRRTQSSNGVSTDLSFLDVSSLNISSSDSPYANQDRTSPSLLHQAKSTTLNQPQSQIKSAFPRQVKGLSTPMRPPPSFPPQPRSAPLSPRFRHTASSLPPQVGSIRSLSLQSQKSPSVLQARSTPLHQSLPQTTSLAPQVRDMSSLPSISQTALSMQTQATSIPSLPPTTSCVPTKTRRNELLRRQSQTAHFHPPQAKTTTSLPLPYMTVPSILPIANTASPPTLYHNGPWPPHPQIASSLSLKLSAPSPLPGQRQTASRVPRKHIAPSFSPAPHTATPVTQNIHAPPLPPQRQSDPVHHIKWNAAADENQLIGHKCLICKRDLAFTPEGPVSVPPIPSMVAVLPCGHTFHDHCLQLITPEDEAKSPPCIPCAIGET